MNATGSAAVRRDTPFGLFFDTVPCPAWLFDPSSLQITAANRAALAAYGFSRDEFTRMPLDALMPAGDRAGFRRQLRRARHGAAASAQRHVTRAGTTLAVTMRWMRDESADGAGASLAWAEPAAAAPDDQQAAPPAAASVSGFQDAPIALIALSAMGQVIEVNQEAVGLLQQPRVRLVGQSWHACVGGAANDDTVAATLMSGEDWRGPVTVRYGDGSSLELDGRTHVRADGIRVVALHDNSERVRTEGELRRSNDRYRRLSDHARHVREEERARLSRDLHDRLGQALTGLKMDLAWLLALCDRFEPTTARSAIAVMMDRIDTSIGVVRRIAADLRPGVLDRLGLQAAIEWRSSDFERRTGVRCRVAATGALPELDHLQSTELFRVFEELLTNVSRHAAATRVRITIKGERGKFALHVYDNGRGIPRDAVDSEQSLGLIGMRERATLLGGTLTISPGRRRGTLAVVRIPVKPRMVTRAAASPIADDGSGEPLHD